MTSKRRKSLAEGKIDPFDSGAARGTAMDLLARRDHGSAELLRKLKSKGIDGGVASDVVERLRGEKLVDDHRYVENVIAFRAARGQGPLRIRAELRRLGLSGEWIENALSAYDDWMDQLQKARLKKFGAAPPGDYADGRRQAQFLVYRGFTSAQIRLALGFDTEIDADM